MKKSALLALTVMSLLLTMAVAPAMAKDKLTKKEAKALLSNMIKDPGVVIKILNTKPSRIAGLWEFTTGYIVWYQSTPVSDDFYS